MRSRVDDFAARAGVSVDTVRYYQAQGLLAQPEKEGRVAWYGERHLEQVRRIRSLKEKGFTLNSIRAILGRELAPADAALVEAVAGAVPGTGGPDGGAGLSLEELAQRTGVSPALLEAIEREGLLNPRRVGDRTVYSDSDTEVVRAGLRLLEAGLPLGELLAMAREHDKVMRETARRAVEMFLRFVRDPIVGEARDEEAGDRLVEAFRQMLPATTTLVANHFEKLLLEEAERKVEEEIDGTSDPETESHS